MFSLLAQGVQADGGVLLLDGISGHAGVAGVEGAGRHGQAQRLAVFTELSPWHPGGAAELPDSFSIAAGWHPAPQGDLAPLDGEGEQPVLDPWHWHQPCLRCKQNLS